MLFFLFIASLSPIIASASAQTCGPTWSPFKSKREGPYYANLPPGNSSFTISRDTEFRCTGESPSFQTRRFVEFSFQTSLHGVSTDGELEECSGSCKQKKVDVAITFNEITDQWNDINNRKTVIFQYTNKNCDNLYWSSWANQKECPMPSRNEFTYFTRKCVDCDGASVANVKWCKGSRIRTAPCRPSWGQWTAGPCISSSGICNSRGRVERKRECQYGDGRRTANDSLCTKGTAIAYEQCTVVSTCGENAASRLCVISFQFNLIAVFIALYFR